ncbi:GAF domain-containing protein [Nafulsella turpanensis]|uniref:GAF domain-containing protein n=1 Tax=Nafulsella turpanensis TaxID=1265690 RepID=UPI001F0036FD|nr:GAF domain-containing protein [Nafulsella turpanensis]
MNLVQPQGVLLVLQKEELRIVQASENSSNWLGIAASELVNSKLSDFIKEAQLQKLRSKLKSQDFQHPIPLRLLWKKGELEKDFSANVHHKDNYLLLELEEHTVPKESESFINIYQEITYVVAELKEAVGKRKIEQLAASELKRLSGFDRVMIYQFDERWNGSVVGEALEEGMDPYLGLHFPASDVPKQARELYATTPYRLIPDVNAEAVKLFPVVNPLTNRLTDIASCVLRAVPLVHTEYLNNMKVGASMSTPILVGGKLWGLISCHHRQAREINYELRSVFEIISGIISSQLSARKKEESLHYKSALHQVELKLTEQVLVHSTIEEGLFARPALLLELLGVEGAVLITRTAYETAGTVPEKSVVQTIVRWLGRYGREKIFYTDSLPRDLAETASSKNIASGLIAIQIVAGKYYLLGFRPEVVRSVNWGGNPNEAINYEDDGQKYHPRNSFRLWKEEVRETSEGWSPEMIETARHLRTAILEKILRQSGN